jgi:catechol 2,3-dioxygenase
MRAAPDLRFSHFGLYVIDIAHMADFYARNLGFVITDRGQLGAADLVFLSRDPGEHHQIVLVSGRPPGLPPLVINQLSFRVPGLEALQRFWKDLPLDKVSDVHPINHGNAYSIYFRDPEGNRIEVCCDTDWYIAQPCRVPLDLGATTDEIRSKTRAFCETQPGFEPISAWRERLAQRIRREVG